jgi:hypothetical protein
MRSFGCLRLRLRPVALLGVLALAACSHRTIAGTSIEDTPQKRAVLEVFSQYKNAMEARDSAALLRLAAPSYFDTTDREHPVDYETLKRTLPHQFDNVPALRLDVTLKDVEVKGNEARVDYYAVLRYDVKTPTTEKWKPSSDDARMKFAKVSGDWKITSGL